MKLAPLLVALVACGGGPQLSNLRCRKTPCQDAEDPLKVFLAVDFTDDTGTLGQGVLDLRVNGQSQSTVALSDIFNAQGLDPAAKKGTVEIDDDLSLDRMSPGENVTVGFRARNGAGHESNVPTLSFTLHLGGP